MSDVVWLLDTGPEAPSLSVGEAFKVEISGVEISTRVVDSRQISFKGLDELTERFLNNAVEVVQPPFAARCVALIQTDLVEEFEGKSVELPANIMKLFWATDVPDFSLPALTKDELREADWVNNLDTLLDATNGVGANSPILFAALECIRKQREAYIQHMPKTPQLKAVWIN
jgi:hypothetical protein